MSSSLQPAETHILGFAFSQQRGRTQHELHSFQAWGGGRGVGLALLASLRVKTGSPPLLLVGRNPGLGRARRSPGGWW